MRVRDVIGHPLFKKEALLLPSTSWYDVSHTIRLSYRRETHSLDLNLLDN